MTRAALIVAFAFVAAAIVPAHAAPKPDPNNFCEGGVDSASCVWCLNKACTLGEAQGDGRTGVVVVAFPRTHLPGKTVRVELAPEVRLMLLEGGKGEISLITGSEAIADGDAGGVCTADVFSLPQFVSPPSAPAAIEQLGAPKEGVLQRRTTLNLGPYTALDTIAKNKDGTFELKRSAVYQNVYVSKSCTYKKTPPTFDSKRWNDIKITIPPLKVTL